MKTIFISFVVLLAPKLLFSQSLFDSKFYDISFTSQNIEEDKLSRINEIKYNSFDNILEKVLLSKDYNNIRKNISAEQVNSFVQNIIIENEIINNNNYYYSNVKVNFNKIKIIKYFRYNKIPYVEFLPEKILTIIYEDDNINKNLFSKQNTYYNYLLKNLKDYNLFKIPNLDINDRFLLTHEDIINQNINKINRFRSKYLNIDTTIILSEKKYNYTKYKIFLFSDNQFLKVSEFNLEKKDLKNLFNDLNFIIINEWKNYNKIQNIKINQINCQIKYFNLEELRKIKSGLNEISIIHSTILNNISYKKNKYDINYFGNKKILIELLKLNNININIENNFCKIYLK